MRVGIVILPEDRWWIAEPKWRAAEEYGFAHAWTCDRLGGGGADAPWFSAVPTLTAAAAVTSTIRLGTLVSTPEHRHPVPFARDLLTLDDLSDGRITLGLGAGRGEDEALLGGDPPTAGQRLDRFTEFVTALDRLLAQDRTTWNGERYAAVDVGSAPGCVQRPRLPFTIAATGPRALAVAAAFGTGWVTTGAAAEDDDAWWTGVAALARRFDAALAAADRPRARVDRHLVLDAAPVYSLSSVERFRDAAGRAAELGFTDVVVHWPRGDGPYAGREAVVERVAEEVLPELAAG
ncbi:LLM class flavin-dependent oxidoreductase [Saccharothrix mutabilis subsp. mutabilis]|uniref:LLM class flavin-dependent oxidoreductase n=1 Tax=Saccharothrix mutabilis subsp. mutabilis TaxID=66855 RepID=A0ABN0U656_9PSEU